ncbi:MAG TPA: MFS transporter, partial [Candidatus Omnitrophota bacterium]|nr:MFS transporter [Candidatus Omnitrophota bacterium]
MVKKTADTDSDDDEDLQSYANINEIKYKSRENNIRAGIFASAKGSFGDSFLSAFAIALNASNSLVVFLTSISGILGPLSQIFGSRLMERHSRKKILIRTILFELMLWIPFAAIAILYWIGILRNALAIIFLFFFAFYTIIANLNLPAWFSWTGDIINERYRGRWFSKRNVIMGFVSAVLSLAASEILDYFTKLNLIMLGFAILFSLAFICRLISLHFYKKQYEPKLKLKKGDYFTFFEFLIRAGKTNFGRFSFFNALLNLAVAISSPLFIIYMLRDLHFSYLTYMVITVAGTIFSLLVMELWGKICDQRGDYFVMSVTALLIPFVPVLWIFSKSPIYLIFIPVLLNGVVWAGFNLASNNFVYDNVRPSKRGLALSYFNMLAGIGIFIGAAIGAFLIQFLTIQFMPPIFFIFLISAVLMMLVVILFL